MNDFEKPSRFIIVGQNGGFSNAICKNIEALHPGSPLVTLSTREFNSKHFRNQTDFLIKSQEFFADKIIWCSGSSSNRSSYFDCARDESALHEFASVFLDQSRTSPHFSFLSSGGTIYGASPGEVSELSQVNPQTAYAEMKVRSENYLAGIAHDGSITLSIFRLANVYGLNSSSNRVSLIEAALHKKEISLTVNRESRKQYGTYDDYASYILRTLKDKYRQPEAVLVQNVFSDHLYSVDDILQITAPHNTYGKGRVIDGPSEYSITETVVLTSIQPAVKFKHKWKSLQDHLVEVSF